MIMKLNLFLSNRGQGVLLAACLGLAILPAGQGAFPAPLWMQGGHAAGITGETLQRIAVRVELHGQLRASDPVYYSPNGRYLYALLRDGRVMRVDAGGTSEPFASGLLPGDLAKGLTVLDMIAPEDHDRARQNIARLLEGDDLGAIECPLPPELTRFLNPKRQRTKGEAA